MFIPVMSTAVVLTCSLPLSFRCENLDSPSGDPTRLATDLILAATLEDRQVDLGDRTTVEYSVFNTASFDIETDVAFYLSTDNVWDPGDTFIESEEIEIDSGEREPDSEQIDLPAPRAGRYFVITVVDPFDQIREVDESNNVVASEIIIGTLPPASVTLRQPCAGDAVRDGLRSGSIGPIAGGEFVVTVDDPLDTAGLPLGTTTFWVVSGTPGSSFPCGTVLPFAGPNASGELLIDASSSPLVVSADPTRSWGGPGLAATHRVAVPQDAGLIGVTLYTQAFFSAPAGDVVLTNALDGVIGY